jgi:hypothetical protein
VAPNKNMQLFIIVFLSFLHSLTVQLFLFISSFLSLCPHFFFFLFFKSLKDKYYRWQKLA